MEHLCFRWSTIASDEYIASTFTVAELVQKDIKMMECNKICHLQEVCVNSASHSSKRVGSTSFQTLFYLITTRCKKPKNCCHENMENYYLRYYAVGGHGNVHGTATGSGLNNLKFKPQCGRDFLQSPGPTPKTLPASSTLGIQFFFGVKQSGYDVDHPTPPSTSTSLLCLHSMLQGKLYCVIHSDILK
jgi:hypothetical protein